MRVKVPYGSDEIGFSVPDECLREILEPQEIQKAENVEDLVNQAIDNPIGSGKLHEIIKPWHKVNILCDDISRPTPADKILPILTQKLRETGVERNNIKIVMALGSHRYMTKNEMIKKVGVDIYNEYKVVNSEFRNNDDLVDLGLAPDGTRVFASKTAMDSDIRIGIGNIVPHPVAGWAGGAKILYPGIAGEYTVSRFHLLGGLANENLFGADDCYIRLGMEKWADTIGLHFIINTILTSDFGIYKVVAGHYVKAHRKGVEYAKEVWGRKAGEKVDIMIVSSFPADQDFWQSGKGFYSAEHGLKEKGGTIILVSPNYEGIGPHKEFARVVGMDDPEKLLLKLMNNEEADMDPLALSIGTAVAKVRKRRELVVVTDGMTREEIELCKMKYYSTKDIQKAIDDAIGKYNNPSVSVITHGGELFVY